MKNLFVLTLLLVGMVSFAQQTTVESRKQRTEKISPEKRSEIQLKKMTEQLGLDAKQQVEVARIMSDNNTKRQAMMAKRKSDKGTAAAMSDEAKAQKRAEMKASHEASNERMKKVLTADQYKKWEQIKAENLGKMKERRMKRTTKTVKTETIKK